MSDETQQPLLSIIFSGRDDNYWRDFVETIVYSVTHAVSMVAALGKQNLLEVVVVDWGSEKSFLDQLYRGLPTSLRSYIRSFHVPGVLTGEQDKPYAFHNAKSANFGVRRSRGKYVWWTGADHIFSRVAIFNLVNFLQNLERLNAPSPFFGMVPRRAFPCPLPKKMSPEAVNRRLQNLNYSTYPYLTPKPNSGGGMGGFIVDSGLWRELEGYSEVSGYYGWADAELYYRVQNHTLPVDLAIINFCVFKLPRHSENRVVRLKEMDLVRKDFPDYLKPERYTKNLDWGNRQLDIREYAVTPSDKESTFKPSDENYPPWKIDGTSSKKDGFKIVEYLKYLKLQSDFNQPILSHRILDKICLFIGEKHFTKVHFDLTVASLLMPALAIKFPAMRFSILHDYEKSCGEDSEDSIGRLAKRLHSFHYAPISYRRISSAAFGRLADLDLQYEDVVMQLKVENANVEAKSLVSKFLSKNRVVFEARSKLWRDPDRLGLLQEFHASYIEWTATRVLKKLILCIFFLSRFRVLFSVRRYKRLFSRLGNHPLG